MNDDADQFDTLLAAARAGDQAAINEILTRLRDWMKRIAGPVGPHGGPVDSSDVVQNAQMKAFQNLDTLQGATTGQFCEWLRRIVVNEALDLRRKQKREQARQQPLPEDSSGEVIAEAQGESPSEIALRNEEEERMAKMLDQLPDRYHFVIRLRAFFGLSFDEIAKVLDTTPNNAVKTHGRAMKKLALLLGEQP